MLLHREIPINVPTPFGELEAVPVDVAFDTDSGVAIAVGAVIEAAYLPGTTLDLMTDGHVTRAAQQHCSDNINAMIADEWLGHAAE
jgi:hypothetical protein